MAGIGERLRRKRMEKGFETAADAARAHGWNANTYRSHENEFRGVPRKWLLTYSKVFGVSLAWLTTGVEERRGSTVAPAGKEVQLLEWAQLPRERGGELMGVSIIEPQTIVANRRVSKKAIALKVEEESMIDPKGSRLSLYPGDSVVLEPELKIKPGMLVLIWDAHDKVHAFRRAEFPSRSTIRFVAFDPMFPSIELPIDSKHIIAVIVEIIRPAIVGN